MMSFFKDCIRAYRHKRILKIIDIPQSGIVLDVSCSDGVFLDRLHQILPELNLFGVDISAEEVAKAKIKFPLIGFTQGDAGRLDFESNTFDIVFSIMSLHHYKGPIQFFEDVFRVLKNDGVMYLVDLVPKYRWIQKINNWMGCSEPYHFERYYSLNDLDVILKPLRFLVTEDKRLTIFPRIRVLKIKKISS
ncbi:MAG: class I SAM-dependent methyltransferase [Candidatus Pacebacteria bacterium]|nr:class I SAM-dependent methyltransferase [Candidatus Paceibacterota bacterium]